MFAALLIATIACLPVTTVGLFVPARHRPAPLARRIIAGFVIAGVGALAVLAIGATLRALMLALFVPGLAALVWLPATGRWTARAHVAWSTAVTAGAAYLAYMIDWTFRSHLGGWGTAGGLVLCALEVAAYLLALTFLWEMVDVLGSRVWDREYDEQAAARYDGPWPFVSLHVPAHNEPPEMVIATLTSLLTLDYPSYEIVMIDDNTQDETLWQPVREFCTAHDIAFHHLQDWPGYKSGALNYALTVTDPRAEIIGIVDADYLVQPDYLRACTPAFAAPRVGFVQTPQDYRDWEQDAYYRRLYHSYGYFFAVSQRSRNELDGAIFGGTMGLIRRSALEAVGGWDEWVITEDAELSLRLLKAGWTGQHIARSFGHGIMPLTFEALKKQRFRWCFGGIQILRRHWRSLLPGRRSADNRLSLAQRWAYLSGALQWYADLLGLAFFVFLVIGSLDLAVGGGLVFRRLAGLLLVAVPALALLGVLRSVALVHRTSTASWRDAIGAFGLWLALSWVVAGASVRGMVEPAGVFLRTPKTRGVPDWRDAVRSNRVEVTLAAVGMAAATTVLLRGHGLSRFTLSALVVIPVLGWLSAPFNSLAAMNADLPAELRRRRRTEWLRAWSATRLRPVPVAAAIVAVAAAAVVTLFVLAPTPPVVRAPDVIAELRGRPTGAPAHRTHLPQGTGQRPATAGTPTPTGAGSPGGTPRPGPASTSPSAPGFLPAPLTPPAPTATSLSSPAPTGSTAVTATATPSNATRPSATPTTTPTRARPSATPTTSRRP